MLEQNFLPLREQFDDGFGSVADGFRDAAKVLNGAENQNGFGLSFTKLPIYFLNRHAIELFLKGIIVILHRRFHPGYPSSGLDSNPTIVSGTKQKQLYHVHDLRLLYDTFTSQITSNAAAIRASAMSEASAMSDWTAIPAELDEWITQINDADSRSTMFRYPVSADSQLDMEKSSFKQAAPTDVAAAMADETIPPQFVLAVKNDDNETVDTYVHDRDPLSNVADALQQCADLLSGTHYGLMADLVFKLGHAR